MNAFALGAAPHTMEPTSNKVKVDKKSHLTLNWLYTWPLDHSLAHLLESEAWPSQDAYQKRFVPAAPARYAMENHGNLLVALNWRTMTACELAVTVLSNPNNSTETNREKTRTAHGIFATPELETFDVEDMVSCNNRATGLCEGSSLILCWSLSRVVMVPSRRAAANHNRDTTCARSKSDAVNEPPGWSASKRWTGLKIRNSTQG